MPLSPVPISSLPDAVIPLSGTEEVPLVQAGQTRKATLAATLSAAFFGPEYSLALAAGNNNNVLVAGNRALFDTTAGDAVITGFNATGVATGAPLIVTNTGPNLLTIANQNVGSLAANRSYGPTDLSIPPGSSMMLVRSGTLLRWVMVP